MEKYILTAGRQVLNLIATITRGGNVTPFYDEERLQRRIGQLDEEKARYTVERFDPPQYDPGDTKFGTIAEYELWLKLQEQEQNTVMQGQIVTDLEIGAIVQGQMYTGLELEIFELKQKLGG